MSVLKISQLFALLFGIETINFNEKSPKNSCKGNVLCDQRTWIGTTTFQNGWGKVKTDGLGLNFMGLSTFSTICNFKGRKVTVKLAFEF